MNQQEQQEEQEEQEQKQEQKHEKEEQKKSIIHSFISGSMSGVITSLVFQPLDVIKTRLQVVYGGRVITSGAALSIAKTTISNEGISGMWRGTGPTLARIVPGSGLYFASIHAMTNFFEKEPNGKLSVGKTLFVGALSRGFIGFILCPLTVVKTRFESTTAATLPYKNTISGLLGIAKSEGVSALFSGSIASIARDAPYSALYLVFYDKFKESILNPFSQSSPTVDSSIGSSSNNNDNSVIMRSFVAGFCAGSLATLVTHPADVVKTRQQVEKGGIKLTDVITRTLNKDGILGFYKGLGPRLFRKALNSAMLWSSYEVILKNWIDWIKI